MRLEIFSGGLITADFHKTKLFPLPFYEPQISTAMEYRLERPRDRRCIRSRFVERTKEMWTPRFRWFAEQSKQR